MTRVLIGTDSTGAGCVKITRGSINPVTEADANLSSFYYNSKWAADVKLSYFESTLTPSNQSTYAVYTPSGSGSTSYTKVVADENADFTRNEYKVFIKNSHFDYMPYSMPLYDLRWRRLSDNRYIEFNRITYADSNNNTGQEAEYYMTFDAGRSAWYQNYFESGSNLASRIGSNPGNGLFYEAYKAFLGAKGDSNLYETTAVVWRLPGYNTPLLHSTALPAVSGHVQTQITSSFTRCSKPGYDVRTALPTQLAFDTSGRPLSIIYADDVSVASGVSSINIGFATTPNMLADIFPYTGSVITFPMARERRSLRLDYWFSGNSIFFDNKETFAIRARFLVFANDPEPLSSGSNNVLRNFTVNGENVVQIVRPGAAATPSFRDIFVDSRWPCLQIIKEGWITTKTNSNRNGIGQYEDTYDVAFDGTGLFPIVKYMTYHQIASGQGFVRPPLSAVTRDYTDSFDYHQGRSTFCQISDNNAKFYTHNGNAERERFSNNVLSYTFAPYQVLGIRYFILGFPR